MAANIFTPKLEQFLIQNNISFLKDEPLSNHTSFKIGGKCSLFITPNSLEQISSIMKIIKQDQISFYIIGKGSNLLFNDNGFDGVIINISENLKDIHLLDDTKIYCSAGISLNKLCVFAMENSLTGLEFAYGIPGSVGGAVYMNAGAYGGEIQDVLQSVDYIDDNGNIKTCAKEDLDLSYRHSFFTDKPYCIIGCTVNLSLGCKQDIKNKMDDLMNRRQTKQPLEYPSGGSTFKRPEGNYASALIDQCGLKGFRVGGAMVSEKHAGFVINYDNATCKDILNLVEQVKQKVKDKTGYTLECEIKII